MISTERYTKSSFSGDAGCVEVRRLDDGSIGVRDSKDTSKPPHIFTVSEWQAFRLGMLAGEFDLPEHA